MKKQFDEAELWFARHSRTYREFLTLKDRFVGVKIDLVLIPQDFVRDCERDVIAMFMDGGFNTFQGIPCDIYGDEHHAHYLGTNGVAEDSCVYVLNDLHKWFPMKKGIVE